MTDPLDPLKRSAKTLQKAYEAGDDNARLQVRAYLDADKALKHADYLYVIARQQNFESWPKLKAAVDARGLPRTQAQERLKVALYLGQKPIVEQLLADMADIATDNLALQIALYDRFTQFTLLAAREAITASGLTFSGDLADRSGVVLGTSGGGLNTQDENYRAVYEAGKNRVHPFIVPKLMNNAAASHVSMRSEEHTSELQSPVPISYAVFCLKKKKIFRRDE